MMPWRQPRQQSGTSRRTTWRRRISMHKNSSIMGQSVQIGCMNSLITHTAHRIKAMLVGHQQNNMRTLLSRQSCRHQQATGQYIQPLIITHISHRQSYLVSKFQFNIQCACLINNHILQLNIQRAICFFQPDIYTMIGQ